MTAKSNDGLILAIEARAGSLAYAVADTDGRLVDWGSFEVRGRRKPQRRRELAERLVIGLQPKVLLLEDCASRSCLRTPSMKRTIANIKADAESEEVEVALISRRAVLQRFCRYGIRDQLDLAQAVCREYPQLRHRLPKKRCVWDGEPYSTALFVAATRLFTFFPDRSAHREQ